MSTPAQIPVAFTFINDGKEWHGGLNYFRSLFLALHSEPGLRVRPMAFVGAKANIEAYGFPSGMPVVRDSVFDRMSPSWLLNKLAVRLTGVPWAMNRTLSSAGARVVSHGSATGSRRLRAIAWIPDFQHMHLPQFFPETELQTRTRLYHDLIERADLVVVSSEAARRDLQAFSPQHAAKGRVLRFCALRPDVESLPDIDVRAAHGISGPYFYIPNQAWAHKDHLTAIRALALLRDEFPDVTVVCSGSLNDYRNPQHLGTLRAEIEQTGLADRFRLLGVVPYPHIARLMLGAVAVINPSLFEGWSTTVEEAKALGVPLLLSGIDVHREQCERGEARFFDPHDAAGLAGLMRQALTDARERQRAPDPAVARERHRERLGEFARTYDRIVAELVGETPAP